MNFDDYKTVRSFGYTSNKDVEIKQLEFINIKKFRSIENRLIEFGKNITILVGRNGTMKTSILGLIAHPFSSLTKDIFGEELKTPLKKIFRLSTKYDNDYEYSIFLKDIKDNLISESINLYVGKGEEKKRHRVVVSGNQKGDGNFCYNTNFFNLSRVYPITDVNVTSINVTLTTEEKAQRKKFYERIFPSREYDDFESVGKQGVKNTFSPAGENAKYDFNSISTGEDNLGAFFNRLLSFQRAFSQNKGNGIFCIDEIEAGLHPAAQIALFEYLFNWSSKYNVQVVFTTHSLYLIETIYHRFHDNMTRKDIVINFISCSQAKDDKNYPIYQNPDYSLAYRELTLLPVKVIEENKIKIFCEDDLSMFFIKQLLKKETCLSKNISFVYIKNNDKNGIGYRELGGICKVYPLIFNKIGFCVFDADVDDEYLLSIQDKQMYMKLIDENGYCIEKRLAVFINELPNDDPLFKDKERASFQQDMANSDISLSGMSNETDSKKFKNWLKKYTKKDIQNYIKKYINTISIESKNKFIEEFKKRINYVRKNLNLPII